MKKPLLFFIGMLCIIMAYADIPSGYYDSAEGLSEQALRSALHNIIDDHTVKSYGDARYILDETDQDPGNSSNIILVYTGNSVSNSWDSGETWNREHVWSKSHGFPDETDIAYSDLHNLKPCHPDVNTDRSDKDFDEGGTAHNIATECNYTTDTWEPKDEVKGDIARIMFYMVVRYEGDEIGETDLELVEELTSYPDPEFGIFSILLQWHYDDPVDDFERNRNDVIYSYQNNRNPFIDHPEYVSKIWGGGTNPAPNISGISSSPEIPSDSEEVNISATITDDGNILNAEVRWGLISGALLDTINMSNSGDTYTTISKIPANSNGTTVYYEIAATDDSSGTSISSEYSYTVNNNPPSIILNEDFSSCPASGWASYSVSGSEDWECSASGYLYANAYGGTGASDDWFISPSINMNTYDDAYLTFKSRTKYNDLYYPPVEVKYSTDYSGSGDPTVATWSDLSATWSAEDSETWTSSGEIDLSSISGANVYIAFRYTSSGNSSGTCAQWEIDDIFISEYANNLPEINQISHSPQNPTESQDINIEAQVTDSDGTISTATIKWGTVSGTYPNSITMSNSGDNYSGTISAQTEGSFIYYVIEAADNDADTKTSKENIVSVNTSGNSLPVVSNILLNPELPGSSDDVTISATITDSDGTVSIAQISWGITAGEYTYTMEMNNSGDEFSGFIPSRDEDTHIYFLVETFDNDGGLTQSSENDYIVNNPPVIVNVTFLPEDPTQDDSVTVTADITDENGIIETAKLNWKIGKNGSYTEINMTNSDDSYSGTIPNQESGDTIMFIISSTDNYGGLEQTNEYSVEIISNNPPTISNISYSPTNPTQNDDVTVSAEITDENGTIETAKLNWKIGKNGSYTEINMTNSGDNFDATIPDQESGDTIIFLISATDSYRGTNETNEYTVVVNRLPIISNVLYTPANPTQNDDVTVSAEISDNDGTIGTVVLKWKTSDSGSYTDITMTTSGNNYEAIIPKQQVNDSILFTITASDNLGEESSYSSGYRISNSTGIHDNKTNNISIYPNPTEDFVYITLISYTGKTAVEIYDLTGKIIYNEVYINEQYHTINVEHIQPGLYLIKLIKDGSINTQKILIK